MRRPTLVVLAILLAACSATTSSPATGTPRPSTAASASAGAASPTASVAAGITITLGIKDGPELFAITKYLVDPAGRTLYYNDYDSGGPNFTSDQCPYAGSCPGWTTFLVGPTDVLAAGYALTDKACTPAKFQRPGGLWEAVCFDILYYFDGDTAPGMTTGVGPNGHSDDSQWQLAYAFSYR